MLVFVKLLRSLSCACWVTLVATLVATATAAVVAQAQELPEKSTVLNRARPAFDPIGIRRGVFWLFPSLDVRGGYNDNIYAEDRSRVGDFITQITPQVLLRSDWNRHAVVFDANTEIGRYLDNGSEDYEDYLVRGRGLLDITRHQRLEVELSHARLHEYRGSPDDFTGREPTVYRNSLIASNYVAEFGRVALQFRGSVRALSYDNTRSELGNLIDNSDRDRDVYLGGGRVQYEFSPRLSVFLESDVITRRYDTRFDRFGVRRDADGYDIVAGAEFDLNGLIFGNFALGHAVESFDDPRFGRETGIIYRGQIMWSPTGLTTITGDIGRAMETTTLRDSSGRFQRNFGLTIDHELLRNLLLRARGKYLVHEFHNNNRRDDNHIFTFSATYLMNRYARLSVQYERAARDTNANGIGGANANDFAVNRIMLAVRLQL